MDVDTDSRLSLLTVEDEARIEILSRTDVRLHEGAFTNSFKKIEPDLTSTELSAVSEAAAAKAGGLDLSGKSKCYDDQTSLDYCDVAVVGVARGNVKTDHRGRCSPRTEQPSSTTSRGPKRRKTCLVCGDRAIGCNFGVVSCESCKAFFRRMAFRNIRGRCNGDCVVDVESRVYCKACRLKKCFSVGMKKEMIVHDARLKLNQPLTDISGFMLIKQEPVDSNCQEEVPGWNEQDEQRLSELGAAFQPMHTTSADQPSDPGTMDIINMADVSVRRLISCVKCVKAFNKLSMASQIELLKHSAIEVLILFSSKQYDPQKQGWHTDQEKSISIEKVEREGHGMMKEMMEGYISFVTRLKALLRDDLNLLNLMVTICLLSLDIELSDGGGKELDEPQVEYAVLMYKYALSRYDDRMLFPRLIMKLADLKHLREIHTKLLNSVDVKMVAPLLREVFSVA